MKNKRRDFLKHAALTGMSIAGNSILKGFAAPPNYNGEKFTFTNSNTHVVENKNFDENNLKVKQHDPFLIMTSLIFKMILIHS